MPPTPKQASDYYAQAKALGDEYARAFHAGMADGHSVRPRTVSAYEYLREQYVHGEISLERFEAAVTLLLQRAA